jgi:putative SOS response-associated peptidase YedK
MGCFGLVPPWADITSARRCYNARSETVAQRPSFRRAWSRGQLAVIPMVAFYEMHYGAPGVGIRHRIERRDGAVFGVAGLWEHREDAGGPEWSFTLLTIAAAGHPLMGRMHGPADEKRSIVILDAGAWGAWLEARSVSERLALLRLFDADQMRDEPAPLPPRNADDRQGSLL